MPKYVINGGFESAKELEADTWTIRDGYFQFATSRDDGFADQVFAMRADLVQTVEMKTDASTPE